LVHARSRLEPLVISDAERQALQALARKRTASQALAERARIVLACAEDGVSVTAVAGRFGVSREMVRKWRIRFLEQRLDGLADGPRPGAPRKITDELVEVVITRTLTARGPGRDTHWSTRTMAARTGLNQTAISRIWRAFGLKPHLTETWKLSSDPQFIAKVRDVVGLYLSPPENALVLAVNEKSQIQAIDRSAPCLPVLPTTPERMTDDYVRDGTTSLFAAYDIGSGSVIAQHSASTAIRSSSGSSSSSTRPSLPGWSCTWSWTTTPPTRPRKCTSGCCGTPGSTCTSRRPARRG
jgi:transposase